MTTASSPGIRQLLNRHIEAGVDEILTEQPINWFSAHPSNSEIRPDNGEAEQSLKRATPGRPAVGTTTIKTGGKATTTRKSLRPNTTSNTIAAPNEEARIAAEQAENLDELYRALMNFNGCALKRTATHTVIADGNPRADVVILGEAPGAEEDRIGKPFVGPAGQLLDKMLAAIGLNRDLVYISNVCFWRPPGNRRPTEAEWAACRPFTLRQLELLKPKILFLLGGSAAQQLLRRDEGITRSRGKWELIILESGYEIDSLASFHPAYLLRQPAFKRDAWIDLNRLRVKLDQLHNK